MAKYEDYVKNVNSGLEAEIQEAADATETRKLEGVPESVIERFKDKSTEDVLRSYAELEKAYSKQGQKHGELRKNFDEFIALQSQVSPVAGSEPTEETTDPITVDDLYEDPEKTVSQVVRRETDKRIKQLEASLEQQQVQAGVAKLNAAYPDWQNIVQSEEFAEWVQERPYRANLAARANQFDFAAADEILSMYADLHATPNEAENAEANRLAALSAAQMESGTPEQASTDEYLSRSFLIETKLAARRGNGEAQAWLQANKAAIEQAYAEGRVVD